MCGKMCEYLLVCHKCGLLEVLLCRCRHKFRTCKSFRLRLYKLERLLQHLHHSRGQVHQLFLVLQELCCIRSSVCLLSNLFRYMLEPLLHQLLRCGLLRLHNYLRMHRHKRSKCMLCNPFSNMLDRLQQSYRSDHLLELFLVH